MHIILIFFANFLNINEIIHCRASVLLFHSSVIGFGSKANQAELKPALKLASF
jgi:hypothetical protein